jgi:hypothetical protein
LLLRMDFNRNIMRYLSHPRIWTMELDRGCHEISELALNTSILRV